MKLKFQQYLISFFLVSAAIGCTPQKNADFAEGMRLAEKESYLTALSYFDRTLQRYENEDIANDAAREAARISYLYLKDFSRAARYYRYLVLHSKNDIERFESQNRLVDIYFDHLNDYSRAMIEIEKISKLSTPDNVRAQLKLKLARCHYYLNNFEQSIVEAKSAVTTSATQPPEVLFDAKMLEANALLALKKTSEATVLQSELLRDFPDLAIKENIGVTLAVALEESKDFKKALETLESIRNKHPQPELIDIRIQRIKLRIKEQPGARGLRK